MLISDYLKSNNNDWRLAIGELIDDVKKDTSIIENIECGDVDDIKLKAMFASTVHYLSYKYQKKSKPWARKMYFLDQPWFPAGIENLKAMAILESPFEFRANNIFVLSNFLDRV